MELLDKKTGEYDVTDEIAAAIDEETAIALKASIAASAWEQAAAEGEKPTGEWWKVPRKLLRSDWPYK